MSVAVAPLLLAGCGDQGQAVEVNGVTFLIAGNRSGASDQRIVGTLRELDGCLGLELGENRWIAVFPEGSEPAEDGLSVTLSNGDELRVGDRIEAGGDFYESDDPMENAPAVPDQCGDLSAALLSEPHVVEGAGNN